jgi:hypothetical protein
MPDLTLLTRLEGAHDEHPTIVGIDQLAAVR